MGGSAACPTGGARLRPIAQARAPIKIHQPAHLTWLRSRIHWAVPAAVPNTSPDRSPIPEGIKTMTMPKPAIQPIALVRIQRQVPGIRRYSTKLCSVPAPTPAVMRAMAGSKSQPSNQPDVVAIIQ